MAKGQMMPHRARKETRLNQDWKAIPCGGGEVSKRKRDEECAEAFYVGVICALLVVVSAGEETLAREILASCDDGTIRRIAKREGDDSIVKLVDDYRRNKRESAALMAAETTTTDGRLCSHRR
jgi:hypothetical protein